MLRHVHKQNTNKTQTVWYIVTTCAKSLIVNTTHRYNNRMASVIAIGVTFLLFFISLGLLWLLGSHIITQVIIALPVPDDPAWREIRDQNVETIRYIMVFLPGVLMLFACIKMLVNATRRGED